jgi:hypothetical protein
VISGDSWVDRLLLCGAINFYWGLLLLTVLNFYNWKEGRIGVGGGLSWNDSQWDNLLFNLSVGTNR